MLKIKFSQLDFAARIQIVISYFLKISLVLVMIAEIFYGRWPLLYISVLALVLMFLPALIQKNLKIILPVEFEFIIILFIYASVILGEKHGYYERFVWWDMFLHLQSGLLLGLAGFLIVYILYSHDKVKMSPVFVSLFSLCFSIAIGTVWEIFEFFMDRTFGLNMQKSGLVDTMRDLIINCFGALIAALGGYYYVKGGHSFLFDRFIKKLLAKYSKLYS